MEAPDRRKIRSRLLRSRCYRPGHGTTSCGTDAGYKTRHGCDARERPALRDFRPVRYGRGFSLVGSSHVPNFFILLILIPDRAPVFCPIIWPRPERLGVTFRGVGVL